MGQIGFADLTLFGILLLVEYIGHSQYFPMVAWLG